MQRALYRLGLSTILVLSTATMSAEGRLVVTMVSNSLRKGISSFSLSAAILLAPSLEWNVKAISSQDIAQKFAANQGATIVSERKLGMVKGTLQGCSANENCFSTSAKSPGRSIAPWSYSEANNAESTELVWNSLAAAVHQNGLTILQVLYSIKQIIYKLKITTYPYI
jgi:hypothetical protein